MKTLNERITDLSAHLQSLTAANIFPKVQYAVERKDRALLVKACRKAKIPEIYLASVVSLLLSVGPNQKWPPWF